MTRQLVYSKIFNILLSFLFVVLLINERLEVSGVIAKEKTKTCKDVNCTGIFFSTTATRDFLSNHPSFKTLRTGDKIDVVAIKFSHRGDIMEGVINGERGYFYTNFVDKDPYHNFLLDVTASKDNTLSIVSFSEDKIGKGLHIKNVVAAEFLDGDLHMAFNPNEVYVPKKDKEDDSGHGHSHGGHGHSHGGHGHSHGGHGHSHEETAHNHGYVKEKIVATTTKPTIVEEKTGSDGSASPTGKATVDPTITPQSPDVKDHKSATQDDLTASVTMKPIIPNLEIVKNVINSANLDGEKVGGLNTIVGSEVKVQGELKEEVKMEVNVESPNTGMTTPAPIVAEVTTPPPIAAEVTTPTPIVAEVTTPAPIFAEVTTPPPIVVEVTTPTPVVVEMTTPAPVVVEVTTPAPVAAEVTTPTPIVVEATTAIPIALEMTTPVPVAAEVTTPAPVVAEVTTPAPIAAEMTTTLPTPVESATLPPLGDLPPIPPPRKIPSLNTMDLLSKSVEELIKTTTPSPSLQVDSITNETTENLEQESKLYEPKKVEEIKDEKSFLQLYIGYYLKMAVGSFRETLPQSLAGIDDSGIILLILAPISILVHLTNKWLLSDDESQDVFERKYLHDSLTKIKEQEVMINKLRETQADPQVMMQYQNIKEEYERIYKENEEIIKLKENLMYDNGNFKKMLERKENENHTLKDEIKNIREKLIIKEESLTSLEKITSKLENENDILLEENRQLKVNEDKKDKKISDYCKEIEKSTEENKQLKCQIVEFEEELKNSKVEHDKLRKEIEGLSELLEEINQNSQNPNNEGDGSIGSTGWSDVGDVEIESAGSNSLGKNGNGKRRSPDLGGGNLLDLARSRAEIKRLEQEIEEVTSKLNKEKSAKEGLLDKISLLDREIEVQKNELTHNATERNENSAQISRLLTLVEERSNEIKDLQNREKKLQAEYMELDQKYRDLRDEKLSVEFKCKESESLVKSLQSEVNKLETINYNEVRKLKTQIKLLEEEKNSEIKGLKFQNETLQSRLQLNSSDYSSGSGNGNRQPLGLSEGLPINATNPLMNTSGPIRPLWSDVDDTPVVSSAMRNQASLFGSELDSSDNGSLKKNVKIRKSIRKSKPPLHEGMLNATYNSYVIPPQHLEYASSSGRRSVGREILTGAPQGPPTNMVKRARSRSQGREGDRLVSPLTFTGYDFPDYRQNSYHHLQPPSHRQK
uniref:Cellulosome anchoring protein cohesin region n=1 Tax=Strongyloides venezuelensis TaxID=75913 RepID=A0A0K0FDC7_STRVS